MYTTGKEILRSVTLTLLEPAINLLDMIDANKLALTELYAMSEDDVNEFVNEALAQIRKAREADHKARKMCEEKGISFDTFIDGLKSDLKSKGIDADKEYDMYKQAMSDIKNSYKN